MPRSFAYFLVTVFLFTGAGVCSGVAIAMGLTLGEGETLLEATFWPGIGAFAFVGMIIFGGDEIPTTPATEKKE